MVARTCLLLLLIAPVCMADVGLSVGGCVGGTCGVGDLVPLPRPIQRRQQQVPPMVVRVESHYGNTKQLTTGSLLQGGWIVTCSHGLRTGWQVTVTFHDGRGVQIPAANVHIDDGNDMALIRVPMSVAASYRAIPLAEPPSPGATVVFAGFGGGRYGSSTGRYTGVENDWLVFSGGEQIEHGDSGGPIYTPGGGLVAIISEVASDGRTSEVRGCGAVRMLAFIEQIVAVGGDGLSAPDTDGADDNAVPAAPMPTADGDGASSNGDQPQEIEQSPEPAGGSTQPQDANGESQPAADNADSDSSSVIGTAAAAAGAASAVVGASSSLSTWTAVAAALGVSGPIGVGIGVAGWLISRRIKQRATERSAPTDRHQEASDSSNSSSRPETTDAHSSGVYHAVNERIEKQPRFVKVTEYDKLGEAYKEAVNREVEWQTASGRGAEWFTIGARIHDTARRLAGRKKEPERSVTNCHLGWSDN